MEITHSLIILALKATKRMEIGIIGPLIMVKGSSIKRGAILLEPNGKNVTITIEPTQRMIMVTIANQKLDVME